MNEDGVVHNVEGSAFIDHHSAGAGRETANAIVAAINTA